MVAYNPNVAKWAHAPRSVVALAPDQRAKITAMLATAPVAPGILPPNQAQGQPTTQTAQPVPQTVNPVVQQPTADLYIDRLPQNEANVIQQQQREQAAAVLRQQQAAIQTALQQQKQIGLFGNLRQKPIDKSQLPRIPRMLGGNDADSTSIRAWAAKQAINNGGSPLNNRTYTAGQPPLQRTTRPGKQLATITNGNLYEQLSTLTKPRNTIS